MHDKAAALDRRLGDVPQATVQNATELRKNFASNKREAVREVVAKAPVAGISVPAKAQEPEELLEDKATGASQRMGVRQRGRPPDGRMRPMAARVAPPTSKTFPRAVNFPL